MRDIYKRIAEVTVVNVDNAGKRVMLGKVVLNLDNAANVGSTGRVDRFVTRFAMNSYHYTCFRISVNSWLVGYNMLDHTVAAEHNWMIRFYSHC